MCVCARALVCGVYHIRDEKHSMHGSIESIKGVHIETRNELAAQAQDLRQALQELEATKGEEARMKALLEDLQARYADKAQVCGAHCILTRNRVDRQRFDNASAPQKTASPFECRACEVPAGFITFAPARLHARTHRMQRNRRQTHHVPRASWWLQSLSSRRSNCRRLK